MTNRTPRPTSRTWILLITGLILVFTAPFCTTAATRVDRVLVLRNANSPISCAIADDYATRRRIPNTLTITCPFLPTTGGQSLIVDLIQQGTTGAKGYTDEPLLQAVASPSILFDRYTRGWTLAESYYAASRLVGWQDIVIGDPLCQPYSTSVW